jgi:hypothetical protein
MSILNIQPVKSGQSKPIIAIAGPSGSGKTLTALLMARGMVDDASEIGFLDTENKRGSLYHNALDGKFMIGDLFAPFSPERYSQSIKEFQNAGIKVLVIDSVSHEWEAEGGVDDIANMPKSDGSQRLVANWVGGKKEHKKFMSALLYSSMTIICCIRAREKTDFKNITKPISLGIQPICEKNFMFEMTASIMMSNSGKNQTHIKVPNFLLDIFGKGNDYLGIETGRKIKEYFTSLEKDTPEIEKLKSEVLMACEKGVDALTVIWNGLDDKMKITLKDHFAVCKESAKAYDKIKLESSQPEKTTEFEQEQQRINDFLLKVTKLSELEQFENSELSSENFELIKTLKSQLNE